jgi:hypothetical protein
VRQDRSRTGWHGVEKDGTPWHGKKFSEKFQGDVPDGLTPGNCTIAD